ncbi:alpha/beta fold hydrolase [Paenalkalicoccus suaedae]|uniref:Alpha/beta fold hydrolase n=1 Tax=Paenalkalicoccus suaedae TaxID=2592382 RepID=A0A859FJH4_9BACI|nr:alpha/beta fold hydrolase [Paenalkalicoccus suaedae]QKS72954.1 alpha/beta fold hydrolase [Paenalkalicoccus suaedae]
MKRQFTVWFVVMLVLSMLVQPVGLAGGFKSPGNDLEPGAISIGATPAVVDPNKPVIVFVQGLTNDSTVWYQNNNMYNLAVQAGYQTAFVELFDSGGTPQSYWDNGALLADQLQQISNYFGGKKLTVVAYSKGGVDTQVALIHEGKYPLVSNVITLGSPHYGSELADLANSSGLGWLADLIGQNSPGTQSLQTATMNYFRSITDNRFERSQNNYYTIAGNRTGPAFSSYWFGSGFISGPSDGVVSVASATLPYAPMLAVGNWNHGEVNIGSNVFSIFRPQLTIGSFRVAQMEEAAREQAKVAEEELQVLVRGGEQFGEASETFYVEEEATGIVINWLSATEHDTLDLLAPGETTVETFHVESVADETMFFEGAYHHTVELDDPLAGEWTVSTATEEASAYAMLVTFDSLLNEQLHVTQSGDLKEITVEQDAPDRAQARGVSRDVMLDYDITFTPEEEAETNLFGQRQTAINEQSNQVKVPELGEGLYTVTADVEGESASGTRFERTLITSIYIDEEGNTY